MDRIRKVVLWTGAGQIGMAIARRIGYGKKIIVGDRYFQNAQATADLMNGAGFDVVPVETDISSRESILNLIAEGQKYVTHLQSEYHRRFHPCTRPSA